MFDIIMLTSKFILKYEELNYFHAILNRFVLYSLVAFVRSNTSTIILVASPTRSIF